MDTPTVSVVLATNRLSPYLDEALRSVTQQTLEPVDVVVIDDGSDSPQELADLVARHDGVRLLRQSPAGVSIARNYGVTMTSGEFLTFLDDDDRWHPRRLELSAISLQVDPAAVVSHCRMRTIDHQGHEMVPGDQFSVATREDVLRRVVGMPLPSLMIRRSTFYRIGGFHPSFRRAQDLDLVLKAANEGSFTFVGEVLVDYRYHAGNNTRRYRELAGWIRTIISLHAQAARENDDALATASHRESTARNDRFAAWSAGKSAKEHMRNGRPTRAVDDLMWSLRFAPRAPASWLRRRAERILKDR